MTLPPGNAATRFRYPHCLHRCRYLLAPVQSKLGTCPNANAQDETCTQPMHVSSTLTPMEPDLVYDLQAHKAAQ